MAYQSLTCMWGILASTYTYPACYVLVRVQRACFCILDHLTSLFRQFRSEVGSSSVPDEAEDLEEEPLVWRRRKPISSGSETAPDIEEHVVSPLSSPRQHDNLNHSPRNGADFPSDEVFSPLF